jgi:ubiquinone/menaquinone biosynthesis C-methylase UbiE
MKKNGDALYRLMVWMMNAEDLFRKPGGILDEFNIKEGQTVVDYGCGPGRYLAKASGLVGPRGKVWAADISPMALRYAKERITRAGLTNVETALIENGSVGVGAHCTDIVYALDMFHAVDDAGEFLSIIHNVIKKDGALYLEDGHQSRETSKAKIARSGLFRLDGETKGYMRLKPV